MKETTVGFKEFRENAEKYISAVRKGKRFVVVRKSEPIFTIVPVDDADEMWETVVDFTKIQRGGIKLEDLLKRL